MASHNSMFLIVVDETHLVTLNRGKRMLFLMKMVKFSTSFIGSLRASRLINASHIKTCLVQSILDYKITPLCTLSKLQCIACVSYSETLSSSAGHQPSISHHLVVPLLLFKHVPVITPVI